MKKLIDGTEVSSRSWYYLLDFNERDNWQTIDRGFDTLKLSNLRIDQYKELFNIAASKESFQ